MPSCFLWPFSFCSSDHVAARLPGEMLLATIASISAWRGGPPHGFAPQRAAVQLSESPLSRLAATDPAVYGTLQESLSVMRPDGEFEQVPVERYIEAEVGMAFPLNDLSERLFASNGPWPEKEFPFPPQAFKRQDEDDDYSFYAMPRFCYHIDEGAVRAITNYYKQAIADGSSVLDICSSWVSHYPADFPEKVGLAR